MNGALYVRIAVRDGESRVIDSYAHAPFHYLPPVRCADAPPLLTVVNSSGGVLGGDVLDIAIDLGPGARLTLRQQAATKVHGSDGAEARGTARFTLGEGALLDYFPDTIIPFARSNYAQTTRVELAAEAVMLLAEIVTAGRLARGEHFAFTRLALDVSCTGGGALLLRDRCDLRPPEQELDNPAILGNATIWGSFYVLTMKPLDPAVIDDVDGILRGVAKGSGGASAAPAGLLGRVASTSLDAVHAAMQSARALVLSRTDVAGGNG